MKVTFANTDISNKTNQQAFNGVRIAWAKHYQFATGEINKLPEPKKAFFRSNLRKTTRKIAATNMDVSIPDGSNCPKFLEEYKNHIDISDWLIGLYNETATKLLGKELHSVNVMIAPNRYNDANKDYKRLVSYNVPALNISGGYADNKGLINFNFPAYPHSRDPQYMGEYLYIDLPGKGMLAKIKKEIFYRIISSNKQLEESIRVHQKFYEP